MGPSSDLSQLSLEQAATLIATRVKVARVHGIGEKRAEDPAVPPAVPMSNGMSGALLVGGLGLGAGLMSSALSKDRRKRWLRNALLGTTLGAGVGGAAGYGYDLVKGLNSESPVEAAANKADATQAAAQANKPPGSSALQLIKSVVAKANAKAAPSSPAVPPPPPEAVRMDASGAYPEPPPTPPPASPVAEKPSEMQQLLQAYKDRPVADAALDTAIGAGVGRTVDWARQRRVTPNIVKDLDTKQMERMNSTQAKSVTALQDQMAAARLAGGRVLGANSTRPPVITTPTGGSTTTHIPPGMAGPGGTVTMPHMSKATTPAGTWKQDIIPAARKVAPRRWGGTLGGAAGGFLLMPAVDHVRNNAGSWWNGTSE